jgi:uncharacterized cupin superfamily protein
MSEPIAFSAPADVDLVPDPIRPNWIIEGKPEARSRRLAESTDGTSSVMAWSCTAGRFRWCYAVDETVHIISGEVFVTDGSGATRRLGATWHFSRRAAAAPGPYRTRSESSPCAVTACRVSLAPCCGPGTRRSISSPDFPRASPSRASVPPRRPGHASLPRSGAPSLTSRQRLA